MLALIPLLTIALQAAILNAAVPAAKPVVAEQRVEDPTTKPADSPDTAKLLETVKASLTIDQPYTPGVKTEFSLAPNRSARLKLAPNDAGITEILFRAEPGRLHIIFGYATEPHCTTVLTPKHPKDYRITSSDGYKASLECTTQWDTQNGQANVTFLAKPMSAGVLEQIMQRHREQNLKKYRQPLEWNDAELTEAIEITIPGPDDANLAALRTKYDLDRVVAGATDDYDKLRRLLKWTHDRWQHNGNNEPSKSDPLTILTEAEQGKRFRCVEYGIVLAGCAQAMGMPARVLGLKRKDVETAKSGAGHVVTEIWLESKKKWVFADGQWDAIPEKDGMPLNAIEFQAAFAKNDPALKIRSSSDTNADDYIAWVVPYLYYFDFNLDQRLFADSTDHANNAQRNQPRKGKLMLVPKGTKNPTVFQRKMPIKNTTYTSNPNVFYAPPKK